MIDDSRWHLKREISVGHIFTTLAVAVGVVAGFYKLDTRLSIIEFRQDTMAERTQRSEVRFERALYEVKEEIRSGFARLEKRLDGKVDK